MWRCWRRPAAGGNGGWRRCEAWLPLARRYCCTHLVTMLQKRAAAFRVTLPVLGHQLKPHR